MKAFRLGLTGSIGMGKSTTAAIFRDFGIPVWDADAAVHRLYDHGGAAVSALAPHFPEAVVDGFVSRETLKRALAQNPEAFSLLNAIIHPLVAEDRATFLANISADLVVLDIPLLFENGTDADCDATLLVTAPKSLQKTRVLARPGMTEAQFELILSRQMPDRDKRAKADHIVETLSLESTQLYVKALIEHIRAKSF